MYKSSNASLNSFSNRIKTDKHDVKTDKSASFSCSALMAVMCALISAAQKLYMTFMRLARFDGYAFNMETTLGNAKSSNILHVVFWSFCNMLAPSACKSDRVSTV